MEHDATASDEGSLRYNVGKPRESARMSRTRPDQKCVADRGQVFSGLQRWKPRSSNGAVPHQGNHLYTVNHYATTFFSHWIS